MAVAARDAESLIGKLTALGMRKIGGEEVVEEQGVKVVMLGGLSNSRVEVLIPLGEDSTVARFLERREGVHHLAILVDDLDEFRKVASSIGLEFLPVSSKGAEGSRVPS